MRGTLGLKIYKHNFTEILQKFVEGERERVCVATPKFLGTATTAASFNKPGNIQETFKIDNSTASH